MYNSISKLERTIVSCIYVYMYVLVCMNIQVKYMYNHTSENVFVSKLLHLSYWEQSNHTCYAYEKCVMITGTNI